MRLANRFALTPVLILLLGSAFPPPTAAQEKPETAQDQPSATSPKPKTAGETKKEKVEEPGPAWPKWFQPTLAIRGRLEQPWGRGFSTHNEDLYYLGRFTVGANLIAGKHLNFFVMGQDARVLFHNDRNTRLRGMKDTFDLRQMYADLHAKKGGATVALRVGRQYLDFGGRRLVAVAGWGNSTPVYDAARLTYADSSFKVDLFASTRVSDVFTYRYNRSRAGENLYGIYTELLKAIPYSNWQSYVLWRTQTQVIGEQGSRGDSGLWTIGFRWSGKLPNRLDFIFEEVLQRGTYALDEVSAYGMIYQIGYQLSPASWKPRLSMEFNYASGDQSRADGRRGTFDQLYPSPHNVTGMTDQVGWQNVQHYKWTFDFVPRPKIKLLLAMNNLFLATAQDALYNASGSPVVRNPKADSRHIGWEPDIQFDYAFSKRLSAGIGVSRLFPGQFLKQSARGHAYTYPYLMWEYKF